MKPYIYAETAFHHEGDLEYIFRLVDLAAEAGADGVKFQVLIDCSEFMSRLHPVYAKVESWCFTLEQWRQIFARAKQQGLDIIMMPLDQASFCLASEEGVCYLDLHSVSFNDSTVLDAIKATNLPVIVGIGGRTRTEIQEKVDFFSDREVVLMHGFQAYPSELKDVKLPRISALKRLYPQLTVGYADHTDFEDEMAVESNVVAYLLGARMFEKHLTIEEGVARTDYEAAVGLAKMQKIVLRLDRLSGMIIENEDAFSMSQAEKVYRNREKVAVAAYELPQGVEISPGDLLFKMSDSNAGISSEDSLVGKVTRIVVAADEAITKEHLE